MKTRAIAIFLALLIRGIVRFVLVDFPFQIASTVGVACLVSLQLGIIATAFLLTANALLDPQDPIDLLDVFLVAINLVTHPFAAIFTLQQVQQLLQFRANLLLVSLSIAKP